MRHLAVIVSTLLLIAASGAAQDKTTDVSRTATVRGEGVITTVPDQVRLQIQVNIRGGTATEAMASANAKTKAILDILKGYGVDVKDIQTSRVAVSPIFDYSKQIQPPPILGYTASNDFSVLFKGKLMEKVGEFVDRAVSSGATGFSNLMYESSKHRELERDALKRAAQDAKARAEVLAKELGAGLDRVRVISESVARIQPPLMGARMDAMSVADGGAPVMTGSLEIRATVDVTFELK